MNSQGRAGAVLPRVVVVIAVCTVILTSSFVGIIALVTGEVTDVGVRVPYYVVVLGIAFVGTIVVLESHGTDGRAIMASAIVVAAATFAAIALAVEGAIVASEDPSVVLDSQLHLYVFAAGLIATGIGYWGIRHWREFTPSEGL